MVLGLVAAVVLAHGSVVKAIAMIVLGLLLGLVGTDGQTGGAALHLRHHASSPTASISPCWRSAFSASARSSPISRAATTAADHCDQKITRLWPTRRGLRACAWPAALRGTGAWLASGRAAGRRRDAFGLRGLRAGEEDRARSLALRQRRSRRRRGTGSRQQCRRADVVHSDAHARHSRQRRDGADDRRHDDPRHPAGTAGDDRASGCSGAWSPRCGSAT